MVEFYKELIMAIITTALASSGLWVLIQSIISKKSAKTKMLLGLGHDRIMALCMEYLERGDWITKDEYENLHDYLYLPYEESGGNGSAKRAMEEVIHRLRIVDTYPKEYLMDKMSKK